MISERRLKSYCCGDFTEIENYSEAIVDTTQKWECHHRLELTEDGEFQYSMEDLIEKGWYYKRPPSELIFLTESEHMKIHGKGISDDTREKMSVARKGMKFSDEHCENLSKSLTGRKITDEWRARIGASVSKSLTGRKLTDEHRENIRKGTKGRKGSKGTLGKHWYNNGIENKLTYDCPDGFVKGRFIKKKALATK